ncbi:MAG: hypothetical protein ABI833_06490 [Acidobacteriota bacterium]
MKYCFCLFLWAGVALAQSGGKSTTDLLIPDLNGNRVVGAIYTANDGDHKELTQSINGRKVPLEQSDTRVLSDGPGGRTSETVTRKYDATGQVVSTERTVVEEKKIPNGAVVHATVYRSDLNGQMAEAERRTIETQTRGDHSTTDVTVSRPELNGSFGIAEKRNIVSAADGKTVHETEVVQIPGANGQLLEAAREVRDQSSANGTTTSTATRYEPDFTGKLSLASQEVATITKEPDGSLVTQVDLYAPAAYGIARTESATPRLKEQSVIVRREKNGVVTESTSVSRPTLQDPSRLGPSGPVSELVCTGKCAGPLQP